MTIIDVAVLRRSRASWQVLTGVAVGVVGVVVLVGPNGSALGGVDLVGALVVVAAALSWSVGSLVSRGARLPASPAMTVAVQMVTGGAVLLVLSGATSEWQGDFSLAQVTTRSALAVLYLASLGSIVSLSAYVWLLRQVAAPAVATYAFVNPVVAVFLGWAFAGETVSTTVLLASALIIGAVVLIQSQHWHRLQALRVERAVPATVPVAAAPCEASVGRVPGVRRIPTRSGSASRSGSGGGVRRPDRGSYGTTPDQAEVVPVSKSSANRAAMVSTV
jgi:EamA domain-containing membrane protein RarD